ncbi:unnamed protein product [Pleuronectes platessa]|uniref:Serine/threonine-protein phosphatase 2A activator n=1 Tax=Pleuronectes platessa TaxID=8262 RepID=A0A9N7YWL6_PLEPL|nr:unnamed protein product [Pleuronectes platessa]
MPGGLGSSASREKMMKTGPFAEHSNQLWNISAVPAWSKVNQGLIRMYKAECLEKFPVIQHFKFGSLLSIQPNPAHVVQQETRVNLILKSRGCSHRLH